jgi:hypothetical protein
MLSAVKTPAEKPMRVLDRLAGALGRRDEVPNVELAEELARTGDAASIAELAEAIRSAPQAVANDAVKTLYEIGERRPELIAPHAGAFFAALKSRNNRMVWGALTAIASLTEARPDSVAGRLDDILDAADRSSVIAKDAAFSILATLSASPAHKKHAWPRLLAALQTSAVNQTPMYAEKALVPAALNDPKALAEIVRARLAEIHQPPKRKRLEKVLRKLAAR